uniref:Sugar transferase n=1 Tax=Eiseniibacteriota bacterium TaxID=2212470 RepID=A0A832MJT7_UNCEI
MSGGAALERGAGAPPRAAGRWARRVAPAPAGAYGVVKRAVDAVVAAVLLILLAPLLALVAVAVRLDSPGPALFRQRRIGRGSAEFVILKFRTMKTGTPDLASHLLQSQAASRITRLGAFLRRTSLDELPQLWNVLCGDMALVGPRPALHNQDDLIELRREAGVDALRPGVTGWAQVNGRDELPVPDKVAYDRWYLERVGPLTDLVILLRTAIVLVTGRGVN